MTQPLGDVVILDLTSEFWSSLGIAMLGDFGAQVIRIDPLGKAPLRVPEAQRRDPEAPWDSLGELANRNKRSLALDLESEEGREIVNALVAQADVFATDWPASWLESHHLGYAELSERKPDLVYAAASGFGPLGPDRDLPALDELAAARTGMMPILPQPGRPPVFPQHGQMYTTVMLGLGITLALQHRRATGEGQEVDVSLLAGNMYGASLDLQAFLAMGGQRFLEPVARLDAGNPMSGVLYPAKDGRWIALTMPDTDRWWPGLAESVGLDPADPRFDTHERRCGENRLELIAQLETCFREHPSAYWKRVMDERQLSADVIEDYEFPVQDEQTLRNRYILHLNHPSLGAVKTLGFPIHMSESPARLERMAPCTGQHTFEILHERLAYSADRIVELGSRGVIA